MRTSLLPLLLALPLVQGCWNMNCVDAPGPVVTRDLAVEPFTGVISEGAIDVEITQGPVQQVKAEGPATALDLLSTQVKAGVWHVRTTECFTSDVDLIVRITVPVLERVGVEGSGDVHCTGAFAGERMEVTIAGSGDITVPVSTRALKVGIQGSGDVSVEGTAGEAELRIAGSGSVEGLGLSAGRADVEIKGSGDVSLTAVDALNARILGSGNVRYRGTPKVSSTITGSGAVTPAP
ncbi:MAG TPA: head GIN domain-containing protein [Flavobacteriales bacterium]|nr:head GIN domain-containing protein [Flavobacteriales bacterium]HMR28938.1 head GIN domain-containing protein [Flavobacteriales bacterium]